MLRRLARALAPATLLLLNFMPVLAAPDPAAPVPVDPALRVGKLDNGLTYYIRRVRGLRLELRLAVKAGSVLEDDDQQGLAHFVEHMAFEGSTHFERGQLVSFLQSIGVKYGADLNAATSFDETVYRLSLPTNQPQHIDTAFTVLEDWAHGLRFDPADVDRERAIMLEEFNLRSSPDERIERQLRPRLFNGARYATRAPLGQAEILRHAPVEALRRFYHDWYRPDLMAVVVAGDIDPDEAERLVKTHFAGLVNPTHERARDEVTIAPDSRSDALVATDPEAVASNLAVRYALLRAPRPGSVGVYRTRLLDKLLSELLQDRVQERLHQPGPPFDWASAGIDYPTPRYRAFYYTAGLNGYGADAALAAMTQVLAQARQYGFSAEELERVRRRFMRSYDQSYNNRNGMPPDSYADTYVEHFRGGALLFSADTEYQLGSALLATLTLDQLNAHARASIPADGQRLVIYRGVGGGDQPTPAHLMAALEAADHAAVPVRMVASVPRPLMPAPPQPGRVVKRGRDSLLDLTQLTLSNGVQVLLKQSGPRIDQILLGGIREGGLAQFARQDLASAIHADEVAASMGAGELSPYEVQRDLAGTVASLDTSMSLYSDNIEGRSGASRSDLETMLQYVWLRFNHVRRDPALFQSFVDGKRRLAANARSAPATLAASAVYQALYGGNPYAPHVESAADIAGIDLDRSLALYRQRFASADGFTFVLVGNFKVDDIIPLLETYLGSLPAAPRPAPRHDVGLRPARGVIAREVHGGDQGQVRLVFSGAAPEYSDIEGLRLHALAEVMNLRIIDVLRARLGLVYAGSVADALIRLPSPNYTIDFTLPTRPEHVAAARAAVLAEIEGMRREGPSAAELEKVKLAMLQQHRYAIDQDRYWLVHLEEAAFDNTDPAPSILEFEQRLGKLTADQVRQAALRYFDLDNYVQVLLAPPKTQLAARLVVQ